MELILVIVIGGVGFWILLRELRRRALMKKYGDKALVDRLMRREVWEGQREELLLDSIGKPAAIDQKVMKTKTWEVWKYEQRSRHRFGLRITLENGAVIGWDKALMTDLLNWIESAPGACRLGAGDRYDRGHHSSGASP